MDKIEINLEKELHEVTSNKDVLRRTTEKFLNNLIDDITLGIIFDTHRKFKTKAYNLDRDDSPTLPEETVESVDIFGQHSMKKIQECVCPNCGSAVAATRFAPHLQQCMGMGRSTRNASRRIANNSKERESSSYRGVPSDDEDDDWSSGDKRRKKKDKNGSKKGKGTPKKLNEPEPMESVNVDVEGDEDDLANLSSLLQDHSNGSSPVDSNSSKSSGSSKKRDKLKSKKSSKKDRSLSSNLNVD